MIAQAVEACDALLAIIGQGWLDAADSDGNRRLDNPTDYVRVEIEAALNRGIPVVPVLVDDATTPTEGDLPPSLA